jgi:hypothetical protein
VLISPTVFLTAGHCTESALGHQALGRSIFVSFDSEITDSSPVIAGSPHTAPDFHPAAYNINSDTHDVGVVTLATPVAGITPAPLPAADLLRTLSLRPGTPITAVGYGVDHSGESGGQVTYTANTTRNAGTVKFRALTAFVTADQVQADGACFGDSGGPDFLQFGGHEQLISLNVVVNGYDCNEIAWLYRLDTPATRSFLGEYVALP